MSHDHQTVDVLTATVTTLVPYEGAPEIRTYTAKSNTELRDLVLDMEDQGHAETIIDVSITPDNGHNRLVD